jgi:hypothetical protein
MGLNIKNQEVEGLIEELSGLIGESKTGAVKIAVQEKLKRVRDEKEARFQEMLKISRKISARIPEEIKHSDWEAELYDEHGLPK